MHDKIGSDTNNPKNFLRYLYEGGLLISYKLQYMT